MDPHPKQAFQRSLEKAIKWGIVFRIVKAKRPLQLVGFLSANPWLRAMLYKHCRNNPSEATQRRLNKWSNAAAVAFLYAAVSGDSRVPIDYVFLYLCERYFGMLNPPSSALRVSPSCAKYFKLDKYPAWFKRLYKHKHQVIFPLIYAQILSNYLTPTRYKLNQRYLSSQLKTYLLDPIWINFRMGVEFQSISWSGLLCAYAKHNAFLGLYVALANWKPSSVVGLWGFANIKAELTQYVKQSLQQANSIANFFYKPSLLSMMLLSLTSPMLTRIPAVQKLYVSNMKTVTKNYIKAVGFASALVAVSTQNLPLVCGSHDKGVAAARTLLVSFYNGINMYLLRVIVLSKWRILKENNPWFTVLRVGTWQRIEAAGMCLLVWQLMNLHDYISADNRGSLRQRCLQLQSDYVMRVMKRVVH